MPVKLILKHFPSESIAEQVDANRFEATTDPSRLIEVEAILICVPTPLDDHREPDLSFVLDTARTIAPYLSKGVLITLESTTYPGTTEDELRRVLEEGSGMKAGVDFHLAYSPEREDPGREDASVKPFPKWSVDILKMWRHCRSVVQSGIGSNPSGFILSSSGSD